MHKFNKNTIKNATQKFILCSGATQVTHHCESSPVVNNNLDSIGITCPPKPFAKETEITFELLYKSCETRVSKSDTKKCSEMWSSGWVEMEGAS